MFIFTDGFWNLVYWQGTVSSRLTLKERGIPTNTYMFPCVYLRCLFSRHAVHVCWDENASGQSFTIIRCNCRMETLLVRSWIKLSVRRIERIGRMDKLARFIVNNEMQFAVVEYHSSNRTNRNSPCRVVNNIFHSPNRTNRLNRQTCKGSLSLMRWIVG